MNIEDVTTERSIKVLIVDDDEFNRLCLSAPLERLDYEISEAVDGQAALDSVADNPPDLILLDLMMPNINGIEVCRRLKKQPETRMIPIIMVTVLDDKEHRVQAIEAGADDFLSKPVDLQEVVLRVKNAARTKRIYDELQASYEALNETQRAQQELTKMIVHDIRSPLTVALGHMELLLQDAGGHLGNEEKELARIAIDDMQKINNMSNALLDVQQFETGKLELRKSAIDLVKLCRELIENFAHLFSHRRLELDFDQEVLYFPCDEEIIRRVLTNLIMNAEKFTGDGGLIRLGLSKSADQLTVTCEDDGQGIPEDFLPRIFDKYTQADTEMRQHGMGIGLAFCKLAVEAHGGTIEVQSKPGEGSRFSVTLPLV